MQRFLSMHELPDGREPQEVLTRLVEACHVRGVRAVETFYNRDRGIAFTLFEASSAEDVREVQGVAGMVSRDILPMERIHTELLGQRRASH